MQTSIHIGNIFSLPLMILLIFFCIIPQHSCKQNKKETPPSQCACAIMHLRSQRTNHPSGTYLPRLSLTERSVSYEKYLEQYSGKINGVFSFFDRMIFTGYIRSFFNAMLYFLSAENVLLKDYGDYAQKVTADIKQHVSHYTESLSCPLVYLNSPKIFLESHHVVIGFDLQALCFSVRLGNLEDPHRNFFIRTARHLQMIGQRDNRILQCVPVNVRKKAISPSLPHTLFPTRSLWIRNTGK